MNPVLMLCRNNFSLTKRAVESVRNQDIDIDILLIDNDSQDETRSWAQDNWIPCMTFRPQLGVSKGWNFGLKHIFSNPEVNHCVVLNNDVVLPSWFCRALLSLTPPFGPFHFVTGIAVDNPEQIPGKPPETISFDAHPDFSAFLLTRYFWDNIGPFNEEMVHYASDCDMHVRGFRAAFDMVKAPFPYLHISSATIKNALPEEREAIEQQANSDRAIFRRLYGCLPGDSQYNELFSLRVPRY